MDSRAPRSSSSSSSRSRRVGAAGRRAPAGSRPRARRGAAGRRRAGRARSAAARRRRGHDPARATPAARRCPSQVDQRGLQRLVQARLRSTIASLPATSASARSSAPVNGGASAARSMTTSAEHAAAVDGGGEAQLRRLGASGARSRGSHIRSQPGPATPTRASMPSSAASSGIGGRGAVERGGHDRRALQVALVQPARRARPDPHARQPPVAAHRLGQRAQQLGHRLLRRARSPKSASSSSGERRTPARAARVERASAGPAAPRRSPRAACPAAPGRPGRAARRWAACRRPAA